MKTKIADFRVGETSVSAHFNGSDLSVDVLRHAKLAASELVTKIEKMIEDRTNGLSKASEDSGSDE